MPYPGEFADKSSHFDLLRNPDIKQMLSECTYLHVPSDEEAQRLADLFVEPPSIDPEDMPAFVVAVDGSNYETSIDEKLPSTKFGFIKVGAVLIDLHDFCNLKEGKFVDPFRVAALQKNNTSLSFFIPSANIQWQGNENVRDSFRALLDKQLYDVSTRFDDHDPRTSLRTTLFHLASMRPSGMGTDDSYKLKVHKCPSCEKGPLVLEDVPEQQYCHHCGKPVYPSDCLRIWEEVNDFQSNQTAITRLMMYLEHLIPAHYIRYFLKKQPLLLDNMAFFVDGPLAVFGNAAWIHRSLMTFLENANRRLQRSNAKPILMIGLQKTGQVVDYLTMVDKFLPNNAIYPLDDDFRYKYMLGGRDPAGKTFGYETYYGQDFIYKTPTGRLFDFLIPYPYESKDIPGIDFNKEKTRMENYGNLARAITLINHFESDLYENAVVPIALAHRYTAISFEPGGKVLDLLTRQNIGGQQ